MDERKKDLTQAQAEAEARRERVRQAGLPPIKVPNRDALDQLDPQGLIRLTVSTKGRIKRD